MLTMRPDLVVDNVARHHFSDDASLIVISFEGY